jgi:hypothetical protein
VVHALAAEANRMRACRTATPRTVRELSKQVRLDLQRIVRERCATCTAEQFRDTWLHAGFASLSQKGLQVALLAGDANLWQTPDTATIHMLFTDGAGTVAEEQQQDGRR